MDNETQINLFQIDYAQNKKSNQTVSLKTKDLVNVDLPEITERLKFLLAGKANFTLQNIDSGNRITYYIRRTKNFNPRKKYYFVSVLTGNNNYRDYTYIGMLADDNFSLNFYLTKNSKHKEDSISVKGFRWLINHINNFPDNMKFYHEGRCAKCGKKLTVPESIKSGFGPECVKIIKKQELRKIA